MKWKRREKIKYILGIDPGVTGAVGVLTKEGKFKSVFTLPCEVFAPQARVKRRLEAQGVYKLLCPYKNSIAYLEWVGGIKGDEPTVAFSLGDSFGVIRGVLNSLGVQIEYVLPATWKKHYKISKEKEVARELALDYYPEAHNFLKRKMDHNRAEAILIGKYGVECEKAKNTIL